MDSTRHELIQKAFAYRDYDVTLGPLTEGLDGVEIKSYPPQSTWEIRRTLGSAGLLASSEGATTLPTWLPSLMELEFIDGQPGLARFEDVTNNAI